MFRKIQNGIAFVMLISVLSFDSLSTQVRLCRTSQSLIKVAAQLGSPIRAAGRMEIIQ